MILGFILREGFSAYRRAKLPFTISILTIALSVTMIGVGMFAVDNMLLFLENLQSDFDVEIFFQPDASDGQIESAARKIAAHPYVSRFVYISKEDAAEKFAEAFGEDVYTLLDYNPLPASIQVFFKKVYRTPTYIASFLREVQKMPGVDEINYKKDLIARLQKVLHFIILAGGVVLFFLFLGAVFLTSNTIKLSIMSRFDFIETLRLIGAGDFTIKAPFLLEGVIQGFLGGLLAIGALYGLFVTLTRLFQGQFHLEGIQEVPLAALVLLLLGIFLGYLGSLRAVRRFVKLVI